MKRDIWLVGHALSMRGLIDAACQTRDVANSYDEDNARLRSAKDILDRLYYQDRSIDWHTWRELHRMLDGAER